MISKRNNIITCVAILLFYSAILSVLCIKSPYPIAFSWKGLIIGMLIGVVTLFTNVLISKIISVFNSNHTKVRADKIKEKQNKSVFENLTYIIFSASAEEILFRSYFLYFLLKYVNVPLAVIINIIIFAVSHFNTRFIELCFMGLVFCLITISCGNAFPAIVGHVTNNGLILLRTRNYKLIEKN